MKTMSERTGHWLIAAYREQLERKIERLKDCFYDVVVEKSTMETFWKNIYISKEWEGGTRRATRQTKRIKVYVHYIV